MQFVFGLVWFDLTELILRSLYLGQPVLLEPTMSLLLNVRIAARHNTSGSGSIRHFLQIQIFFLPSQISFDFKLLGLLWMRRGALV